MKPALVRPLKTPLLEFMFSNNMHLMNLKMLVLSLKALRCCNVLKMYTLNLSSPADLHYTFEVVQNIFMNLDGDKLSNKTLTLKNGLFQ